MHLGRCASGECNCQIETKSIKKKIVGTLDRQMHNLQVVLFHQGSVL